ncbi:cytochrome C oxidase subunit IV family protein [Flavicella sp.]|jgi:cytochrome c oxidase subunit 4|nr:cytochrome C oxidase subunit IV family protein [Flavicella sp.]|tara:strand:- start:33276 stop:33620 length:345 start_codon:yes stop_codon:yes gene_type:complete
MGNEAAHKAIIWKVFGILSVITLVEVVLGIVKPDFLFRTQFLGTSLLNQLFLILTLVKAYYIVWYFMHLGDENISLKYSIVLPLVILIPYLATLLMIEGDYVFDAVAAYTNWKY